MRKLLSEIPVCRAHHADSFRIGTYETGQQEEALEGSTVLIFECRIGCIPPKGPIANYSIAGNEP